MKSFYGIKSHFLKIKINTSTRYLGNCRMIQPHDCSIKVMDMNREHLFSYFKALRRDTNLPNF